MASSHGISRLETEGVGGEKEQEQIREYRALIDLVNAKVRHLKQQRNNSLSEIDESRIGPS